MAKKMPFMIYIDDASLRRAKRSAKRFNTSVSELAREGLAEKIEALKNQSQANATNKATRVISQ